MLRNTAPAAQAQLWWLGNLNIFSTYDIFNFKWWVYQDIVVVIQSLNYVQLFSTPWTAAHQAPLSFTSSWSLLKLMSIESVMPSNHLILRHPILLPFIFPSIKVFSNELALLIRWPKYWSFRFSISPSVNIWGSFPLGLNCLISLLCKRLSRVLCTKNWKTQFFGAPVWKAGSDL